MQEINCIELKNMMDSEEDFQLIDVREEYEVDIASIGGQLIPMGEVLEHLDKIAKDKKVIVYCRSGSRSGIIVQALSQNGFNNVYNLKGGIAAWSMEVDPAMPTY